MVNPQVVTGKPVTGRTITMLKKRHDFLAAARAGRSKASGGLVLQALAHGQAQDGCRPSRLGVTATKKIGNAVVRNRAKRRLRALGREVLLPIAPEGYDFVLIARHSAPTRGYALLERDLRRAAACLGIGAATGTGAGTAGHSIGAAKNSNVLKDLDP